MMVCCCMNILLMAQIYYSYNYESLLFTVMLSHRFVSPDFVVSSIIPIPTGARVALTESEKYKSIAISSLLSKILDHIIIDHQTYSLSTSVYPFCLKSHCVMYYNGE